MIVNINSKTLIPCLLNTQRYIQKILKLHFYADYIVNEGFKHEQFMLRQRTHQTKFLMRYHKNQFQHSECIHFAHIRL